jgi:hypothetical protein
MKNADAVIAATHVTAAAAAITQSNGVSILGS